MDAVVTVAVDVSEVGVDGVLEILTRLVMEPHFSGHNALH